MRSIHRQRPSPPRVDRPRPRARVQEGRFRQRPPPSCTTSPSSHPPFRIRRCGERREDRRLQDVREDFQTVHEPRTRPVEVARTVDEPHPVILASRHVRPPRCPGDRRRLLPSAIEIEPAGHEDRHLGQSRCDFLRRDPAGFFSGTADGVDASREGNHLGNPMSADEKGIKPFEASRSRTFGGQGGLARDAFNSLLEALYDGLRAFLDVTGPTDLFDVLQDFDQVVRVEGHDLRRSRKISRYVLDIPEGGGTHLAQALRQNQVRLRGTERLYVDLVERTRRFEPLADHSARLAARLALILEQGSAHDRFCLDRGRMVAFRRDAYHSLAKPEGVAALRGRGEEGNDPHAARPSDTPRPLKALFKRTRRRRPGWMTEDSAKTHSFSDVKAVSSNLQKGKEVGVYSTVL